MTEEALTVERRSEPWLLQALGDYGTTLVVALAIFLVAYDDGGFTEQSRDGIAIGLWWTLIVAVGIGLWPLARLGRKAFVTGGLIAAFGLFTLLSVFWASSAADAYAEFTRVALYLVVFAVAALAGTRENAGRWCNGLALGITAVGILALLSRLFPYLVSQREQFAILPVLETRLSYPVGYWNGLGILVGLGLPLLLRVAVAGRMLVVRSLAVGAIPALAGTLYFTFSRGGVATAFLGGLCFLAFTSRRWAVAAAGLVAGAGSAVTVLVLSGRDELVSGPLRSSAAESQGRSAALIVAGICVLTALAYALGSRLLSGRRTPSPVLGWALLVAGIAVVVVGVAAWHPGRRFEDFKRVPSGGVQNVETHLLNTSGSGRWQFWGSALRQWEHKPLGGTGAGSYGEWWAEHGTFRHFVQDAHSLYLETLGELGLVGFLLVVAAFVAGIAAAATRLARARTLEREPLAALTAVFLAYAFAAAIDWMWELTVVSIVAFVCLGLMTGPATALARRPRPVGPDEAPGRSRGFAPVVVSLLASWLLICAIAIPLLSGAKLRSSEDAAGRGEINTALKDALDARSIEPWSDGPYLQLALLEEVNGNLPKAHDWIRKAIDRDENDWQLWLVAARIETKQGQLEAGKRSLERAQMLNPRSPLFAASS